MKKTLTVTISRTFEIEIADERLVETAISEFEEGIFRLSENKEDEIFKHVAWHVARCGDECFIEGIGPSGPRDSKQNDLAVRVHEYDDEEIDVVIEDPSKFDYGS